MSSTFYEVLSETGEVIASDMSLETAVILVTALFREWYREADLRLTIHRQEKEE